jgi:hypothetical protein
MNDPYDFSDEELHRLWEAFIHSPTGNRRALLAAVKEADKIRDEHAKKQEQKIDEVDRIRKP